MALKRDDNNKNKNNTFIKESRVYVPHKITPLIEFKTAKKPLDVALCPLCSLGFYGTFLFQVFYLFLLQVKT